MVYVNGLALCMAYYTAVLQSGYSRKSTHLSSGRIKDVMTCGSSMTPTDAATKSPKERVMHSPGTFTSRSHTRGGPNGSSPHMKLAMRPCVYT